MAVPLSKELAIPASQDRSTPATLVLERVFVRARDRKKVCGSRVIRLLKKAEAYHSEPAAAGEESLFGLCIESGGILRFAQNDNQSALSPACLSPDVLNFKWPHGLSNRRVWIHAKGFKCRRRHSWNVSE